MIIKLKAYYDEAMPVMEVLSRSGYNPVMTVEKNGEYTADDYIIAFEVKEEKEEICLGDCDNCPSCTPDCEYWDTCCNGAEMHEPIDKEKDSDYSCDRDCNTCMCYDEECPYWDSCWHAVKPKNKESDEAADNAVIYKLLCDIIESAKSKSRILNE